MEMLEKVELLRERADVTYEEAKAALDQSGGDLLDAMVLLERQGKVRGPGQSTYSTEYDEQKDYIHVRDKVEEQEKAAPSFVHTLGHLIRTILLFIKHTVFLITKDDRILISMPTVVFVLLLLFFWEGMLPVMIIALFFGVRYSFDGTESTKRPNTVLDKAGEFADEVRDELKRQDSGTQDAGTQYTGARDAGTQYNGAQNEEFRDTGVQNTGFGESNAQNEVPPHYDIPNSDSQNNI